MGRVIDTRDREALAALSPDQSHWVYNGLDVCITANILEALLPKLDEVTGKTYAQSLALQAPFMEMMLRGLRVDIPMRERVRKSLEKDIAELTHRLDRLYQGCFDTDATLNPRSPLQVKGLFYTTLNLPEIKKRNNHGFYAPSADREALEKLAANHIYAAPFVNYILAIRDLSKQLGFLNTPIDDDGHIRCSFNIAGTNTGRQSSSISDFGTGTNLQNVSGKLRNMFVAEKGRKFVEIDLEQADSRNVGALCWNLFYESHGPEFAGSYLDACESGDLHTTVCKMCWRDLGWDENDPSLWRAIANQTGYRSLSYRDLAKKLGHGTNYMGQPPTMAIHTKVAQKLIETFQHSYYAAFPCIPEWQQWTIDTLQETQQLTNLFGRHRFFYGQVSSQQIINAAIAYSPQGSTGEEINIGIQNLWRHKHGKYFNLLVQVHDSILFDIPEEAEDELVPLAMEIMPAHLTLAGGRDFHVPLDAKTGWNWGKVSKENPYGLADWKGHDDRGSWHNVTRRALSLKDVL